VVALAAATLSRTARRLRIWNKLSNAFRNFRTEHRES